MKSLLVVPLFCILIDCHNHSRSEVEQAKQNAWQTVKTINRHWAITENLDSLSLFIAPDMIIISPDGLIRGKKGIIDSYRAYADYATTLYLNETEPLVELYNDNKTAIVSYTVELKIQAPDETFHSFICRDMYTLVLDEEQWIAIAQHYSFIKE